MENKTFLIIVIVGILAIYLMWNQADFFNNDNEYTTESKNSALDKNANNIDTNTEDEVDSQEDELDPPNENACGSFNFGMIELEGTQREGDTCADYILSEQDQACRDNPPNNYEGEIIMGVSDPLIYCCEEDGTCYW